MVDICHGIIIKTSDGQNTILTILMLRTNIWKKTDELA